MSEHSDAIVRLHHNEALSIGQCLLCCHSQTRRSTPTARTPCGHERHLMKTLVLNAGYEPLAVVSYRRAIVLVMTGKAMTLSHEAEHPVFGISGLWERPNVVILTRYVKVPMTKGVPLTRRGVLRRDNHRCAYCGKVANTIDHVQPKSRGGADAWDNLVAACVRCNNEKADKTPREMGWSLKVQPKQPHGTSWLVRGIDREVPAWNDYLAA